MDEIAKSGTAEKPTKDSTAAIEKFLRQLYQPGTEITSVADIRWCLLKRRQAQAEKLPPTKHALYQLILREHYQMLVWNNDTVPNPKLPSPEGYGWKNEEQEWVPVMTTQLPAPDAVLHLVKCACTKSKCSTNHCKCRCAGLSFTNLCSCCSPDGDDCENQECESMDDESDVEENDDGWL